MQQFDEPLKFWITPVIGVFTPMQATTEADTKASNASTIHPRFITGCERALIGCEKGAILWASDYPNIEGD